MTIDLDDVEETFKLLDEWEDRYRFIIELGKGLDGLDESLRNSENRVLGCASQVWLVYNLDTSTSHLIFKGDSDAYIVRGLVALVLSYYNDRTPSDILNRDISDLFTKLDLQSHLSTQRANGVRSIVNRIKKVATDAL